MLYFIRLVLVIVSVQSSKTLIKTEVVTRDWGIAVIGLPMLWLGGKWILKLWKAVECFYLGLMGYPSRNKEDFVAKCDLNCIDLPYMVSVGIISEYDLEIVLWYFGEKMWLLCTLSEESA